MAYLMQTGVIEEAYFILKGIISTSLRVALNESV